MTQPTPTRYAEGELGFATTKHLKGFIKKAKRTSATQVTYGQLMASNDERQPEQDPRPKTLQQSQNTSENRSQAA